jgi:hypothetical protein
MAKRFKGVPNLPFAPIAAVTFGVVFAILVFNTPDWRLERLVGATGLASVLPAAKPPLGSTARTLLSLLTALGVSGILWAIMRPIEALIHGRRMAASRAKARGSFIPAADIEMDSQPDWPQRSGRSPIFAESELGAPFMSDEALTKGEELLLDPAEMEMAEIDLEIAAPAPSAAPATDEALTEIDLSAWQMEPEPAADAPWINPMLDSNVERAPDAAFVAEPELAEAVSYMPEEETFTSASPPAAEPTAKPLEQASMSELMARLENALGQRAGDGRAASDAPLAGNIASLHELIGLQRKSTL